MNITICGHEFRAVLHEGKLWLKAGDLVEPLGYQSVSSVHMLFRRHQDEFSDDSTKLVSVGTPGGEQTMRLFTLPGFGMLAGLAGTEQAKPFRRWFLDALDTIHVRCIVALPGGTVRWTMETATMTISAFRSEHPAGMRRMLALGAHQADAIREIRDRGLPAAIEYCRTFGGVSDNCVGLARTLVALVGRLGDIPAKKIEDGESAGRAVRILLIPRLEWKFAGRRQVAKFEWWPAHCFPARRA